MSLELLKATMQNNFRSLCVAYGTNVGGSEYVITLVPRTCVGVRINSSRTRSGKFDVDDLDGERIHSDLDPTEVVPLVRFSLKQMAEED